MAFLHDPTFSHFGTLPACDRQTDGQTHDDRIYRTSIVSCGKNGHCCNEDDNGGVKSIYGASEITSKDYNGSNISLCTTPSISTILLSEQL